MDKYEGRQNRRNKRLRNHADIARVREYGRKAVGKYCVVQILEVPGGGIRLSIVVSRHFSTKAVTRNRARRVLREAWRKIDKKPADGWVLLRPRKKITNAGTEEVLSELQELLRRCESQ
ncbi:MAG: ribonuclease P protein component [Lentisphaeria bacterium]